MSEVGQSSSSQEQYVEDVRDSYADEKMYKALKAVTKELQGMREDYRPLLKHIAESTAYRKEEAGERAVGQRESGSGALKKLLMQAALTASLASGSVRIREAHLASSMEIMPPTEELPVQPGPVPASPNGSRAVVIGATALPFLLAAVLFFSPSDSPWVMPFSAALMVTSVAAVVVLTGCDRRSHD